MPGWSKTRQRFNITLAALPAAACILLSSLLPLSANADYDDYDETFNSWPDNSGGSDGCALGNTNRPAECNGSYVWNAKVSTYPECRSGKCWKGVYASNEASNIFSPKGEKPPSSDSVFVRIWYRLASDWTTPSISQKMMRVTGGSASDMSLVIYSGALVSDGVVGNTCRTSNFNPFDYRGDWFKVEWYVTRDGSHVSCEIWVYASDGATLLDHRAESYSRSTTAWTTLWMGGNRSDPQQQGGSHNEIWIDNVCIGNSLDDRTGFCAEVRPNPPILQPIQ